MSKQRRHMFWKCSQKDLLPKGFLCTFMPQQTGMRHFKCTKAEGPIGVFNVHHCVLYLALVAPNPRPQAHTQPGWWDGAQEFLVPGGNHPVLTFPRTGTEAALDQGQEFPVNPKNPGRRGSLTGNNATEVLRSGRCLPLKWFSERCPWLLWIKPSITPWLRQLES